ncbi:MULTISPECIES: transporter substrate-binding domain-containing protein [Paenibacillus]|uniref:Transporter substrate-binding domain-containing protein n=1 Tax=Paenibacillus agri TaxID=2744309 RepID=A0A850ESV8_9BACL|nr:transporter substrate-binding domain-containing protein [Paenibacillus agri]NUU61882.1 transporter substrate-binding domain-containing protein [Paenibacillus agri]
MKKKVFKQWMLISLVGALVLVLSACGDKNDDTQDALAAIKAKGKIVVGNNAVFAPFGFHAIVDGADQRVGFDIDLAKEIAKDIGVEVEFKQLDLDALIPALKAGQTDILISALSATEERKQQVDFSDIYYLSQDIALIQASDKDKYKSLDDLKGKRIGVQLNSTEQTLMQAQFPNENLVLMDNMNTLNLALKAKQVDVVISEGLVAKVAVAANPELAIADGIVIDDSALNSAGVGVVVKKNEDALRESINKTIKRLQDSGDLDKYIQAASELAAKNQKNE